MLPGMYSLLLHWLSAVGAAWVMTSSSYKSRRLNACLCVSASLYFIFTYAHFVITILEMYAERYEPMREHAIHLPTRVDRAIGAPTAPTTNGTSLLGPWG
jgi:hypothetical protein